MSRSGPPTASMSSRRSVCRLCHRSHPGWVARCAGCLKFELDVFTDDESEPHAQAPSPDGGDRAPIVALAVRPTPQLVTVSSVSLVPRSSKPIPICDVPEESFQRYLTNIEPFDRVLGGGLVVGSVLVLGGEPGVGKSSVAMQALAGLDRCCLYATGEESLAQAASRARRINADSRHMLIVAETDLDMVLEHALDANAEVVLIDSIQTLTCSDVKGGAGSVTMVRECANRIVRFAKAHDVCVLLIGHVTSDGALAGPKTLTHLVDVVLDFEAGEGDERILTCPTKNRFGATRRDGRFMITKDGLVAIAPRDDNDDDHERKRDRRKRDDDDGETGGGGLPPGGFH